MMKNAYVEHRNGSTSCALHMENNEHNNGGGGGGYAVLNVLYTLFIIITVSLTLTFSSFFSYLTG